jgi:general stress protein 26
MTDPATVFDGSFSEPGSEATPWDHVRTVLDEAEIFWLSTVRGDGRPHVAPLLAVWQEGALHFCTGPAEQKARNLEHDPRCILTTGCNKYETGLDVVVEGTAVRITDPGSLRQLADSWTAKFGTRWKYEVGDGVLVHQPGPVLMFRLEAAKAFAFSRSPYVQTSYRF